MAIVKNVRGSSDLTPPNGYDSWKDYWECKKRRLFTYCSCTTCSERAEVGGHVEKVYGSGEKYIVPICYEHNNYTYTSPYEVHDDDLLKVE